MSKQRSSSRRQKPRSHRNPFSPLNPFLCSFGGSRAQAILLILVPSFICALLFAAGADSLPVWKYEDESGVWEIGARGYSVGGNAVQHQKYLYDTPWPAPVEGLPPLLLAHVIIGAIATALLAALMILAMQSTRRRSSDTLKSRAFETAIRKPNIYMRILMSLMTLVVGALLSLNCAVWGVAQARSLDLKLAVLGYLVCIGGFLLWAFWI
ncbi:hypothetical protein L198_03447 [Cryptococcus wingfieldii CBS 7118]|uniref:Uncharacterized protein n=1 Tax=Cryptococcus wingfieldii CBS 7118 TaxID=1295528 RepID=A0A1E3JFE8_9TREE|nr:hypothetical protein L198_03447 [Cryptococcus wingfieldii CBS 7118]ODN99603.1 hypothetical protein L198_03447 [Cryptococcus wingfieldii CBS 7118]